ncbi:MAG: cytochrome P460 family protein [Candidatus Thiodiazotropha sp. (ex Semelilucina semeliformis)]|nr:cytochrome P460 family protein [Candidatus Thiodiazotropha sp. (ex Myrtea spinifera)]MCU7807783.1 cytochrome P460 family protein [Candidatus Thiodiazotropha sp. (ex Semelilucina semeliformis)]MCU7829912.1 cytochrome P460 family protein [Candidatus Thiodiazotropha sp. (ex Myrtea sp. 'scaly one' KF741663)]
MKYSTVLTLFFLLFSPTATLLAGDLIDYPDGYRLWAHVKSMTIHKGHPLENPFLGTHHVYANRLALEGLNSRQYRDGSIFVFDQLQSKDSGGASVEGERVLVGVMVKDSTRFPKTDGWGYEGWSGNSRVKRLVNDNGLSCHGCHQQQKSSGYVFSQWRE